MSVQAMSWAYRVELLNSGDKFLLVTLANFADEWGVCWPGIDTLAECTALSERKVRNGLAALEEAGLIVAVPRRRGDGTRRTDVIVLVGYDGRRRARRPEDHAAVDLVAVDRAVEARAAAATEAAEPGEKAADDAINRHAVPVAVHVSDSPSTGTSCRINRHVVPVHIRNEPSIEPSGEEEEARVRARDPQADLFADDPSGHQEASDPEPRTADGAANGAAAGRGLPADVLVARICESLGHPDLVEARWWRIEADLGRSIASWRALGLDDAAILAVARKFGCEMPEPPTGPKALDAAMARAAKRAEAAKQPASAKAERPVPASAEGCRDVVELWAQTIARGGYVPQTAVSAAIAREMLARGLVTADDLRRSGIAA